MAVSTPTPPRPMGVGLVTILGPLWAGEESREGNMTNVAGGCQCGAIRYHVVGALEHPHICHCRMCQKATGNYFLPVGRARWADVRFTRGEPAWFSSSDLTRRGFCSGCGTPLFQEIKSFGVLQIALGSLDDPAAIPPVFQCGTESRMPWHNKLAGLPDSPASEKWYAKVASSNHQHPDEPAP
jgi:hypothetical protein